MVNKLTDTVKPLDEINKINEIIDELDNVDALPSQTGQSGKFLTTDGTDASWGIPTSRNIGEIVQSSLPLTDAGLHLLDGALLSGDGIYGDFVDYIANNYTVLSTAFTSESAWQSTVTNYGSCGKFVYDSTNNTVRLPKVSDILQGTTDVSALGNLVEAGLPNITGQDALQWYGEDTGQVCNGYNRNGALAGARLSYENVQAQNSNHGIINAKTQYGIGFDASLSNPIYGNSDTVQPQTIKVLTYIVIATSTKTDIQVDIDQIATDLNQKQDINTCVLKTGDTMSGVLRLNSGNDTPLALKKTYDYSTATSADSTYNEIQFQDYTGTRRNTIRSTYYFDASGNLTGTILTIGSNLLDGSAPTGLYLKCDANNDITFEFPRCTTKATTTSSAANNKVAVIVRNYVNGASWYRVWSDGWIEQGGTTDNFSGTDQRKTVNLLKTFSNTNYTLTGAIGDGGYRADIYFTKNSVSQISIRREINGGGTNAPASWYACGY